MAQVRIFFKFFLPPAQKSRPIPHLRQEKGRPLRTALLYQAAGLLVASAPDVHLLRVGDELLAEVGMRHGDQRLGALPGGQALEVEFVELVVLEDVERRIAAAEVIEPDFTPRKRRIPRTKSS